MFEHRISLLVATFHSKFAAYFVAFTEPIDLLKRKQDLVLVQLKRKCRHTKKETTQAQTLCRAIFGYLFRLLSGYSFPFWGFFICFVFYVDIFLHFVLHQLRPLLTSWTYAWMNFFSGNQQNDAQQANVSNMYAEHMLEDRCSVFLWSLMSTC